MENRAIKFGPQKNSAPFANGVKTAETAFVNKSYYDSKKVNLNLENKDKDKDEYNSLKFSRFNMLNLAN